MADNINVVAPTSGAPIRTDDVGGVQYQVVKLDVGGDGASIPVVGSLPVSQGAAGSIPWLNQGYGLLSTLNSTSVNLAANAVFTGLSEDVRHYSTISIQVFSAQASAINGLSIQWSLDGTNWDGFDTYTIPASTGRHFTFGVIAPFIRVVYTNGATTQTTFRLGTLLHSQLIKPSSMRISDIIPFEQDAELTKSIIAGRLGASGYDTPDISIVSGLNALNVQTLISQKATYRVTGVRILPGANLTAATAKQFLEIWHASTVLKTVKIRRVLITISNNTVASVLTFDIMRITAAPTGGTAIVPAIADASDPVATSSINTLPTTDAASTGTVLAAQSYNLGVIAGTTDSTKLVPFLLYDYQEGGDQKPLTIRSGVTEGFAIRVTPTVATIPNLTITVEFTEE